MVDHTVVKSDQVLTGSKGASSAVQRDENFAFDTQIEEVDRALDNLSKTGKLFTGGPVRRDSMPMMGGPRSYSEYGTAASVSICRITDIFNFKARGAEGIPNTAILSAITTKCDRILAPTFRASTLASANNPDRMKRSK
ncbi:MAG: hypothetical protein Q9228_001173 [Teloschistes exilis]